MTETVKDYIDQLPEERKDAVAKLRKTIKANIPHGFKETISYGHIGYVVPYSIYPDGYHCDPRLPLPFIGIASIKSHIALHHFGLYIPAQKKVLDWFVAQYPAHSKKKLDMGKSCIRFKKPEDIPYELIAQLAGKITVQNMIDGYEASYKNSRK